MIDKRLRIITQQLEDKVEKLIKIVDTLIKRSWKQEQQINLIIEALNKQGEIDKQIIEQLNK